MIKQSKSSNLAKCAIAVVLACVSARICIPIATMPITFQTAVCVLISLILGSKYAFISMACYLLLGLIGIPVFVKGGGLWYVSELSFGYILGYLPTAIIAGAFQNKKITYKRALILSFLAVVCNYVVGITYFCIVWAFILKSAELWQAVFIYNITFLIKDIALCFVVAYVAKTLNTVFYKK